jgi:quinol-cytochrome oxidoreductase complex cytochrome b subunit
MVMISTEYWGEQFPWGEDNSPLTVYMNVTILVMMMMMMMQNCGIVMISPEYRGEQFPRGEDNSALTVFMMMMVMIADDNAELQDGDDQPRVPG